MAYGYLSHVNPLTFDPNDLSLSDNNGFALFLTQVSVYSACFPLRAISSDRVGLGWMGGMSWDHRKLSKRWKEREEVEHGFENSKGAISCNGTGQASQNDGILTPALYFKLKQVCIIIILCAILGTGES